MDNNMILENFANLITTDLYIIIAAVYGICFALKKAAFFADKFIPLAAIILGIVLELAYTLVGTGNIVEGICKGVVCGIAAVYVANVVKQLGVKSDE